MADAEIKSRLEALLSEAHSEADAAFNRILLWFLFVIFLLPFIAFATAYWGIGFGVLISLLISLVVPGLIFIGSFVLMMVEDGRRARRYAERFRQSFLKEGGSFEAALALLKTAKTNLKVETDLIEVLEEVSFAPEPGLMGDLGSETEVAPKARRPVPPDYVPLDPYVPEREGAEALPLADPERERMAEQTFSEYERMSPEEWAARYAHGIGTSAMGDYAYRNKALQDWIHRLFHVLLSPDGVRQCRERYLTPEQIAEIERQGDWLA